MNFLVGAQLPRCLCHLLRDAGHDAVHTLDWAGGNRTPDRVINQVSMNEKRVVITKDADFVDSLIVQGVPYKLLLIATGNIKNRVLEDLLTRHLSAIVAELNTCNFIELDRGAVRSHF